MKKIYSDDVKRLASILHLSCHHNHTDYCGWFYGEESRSYDYDRAEKELPEILALGITLDQLKGLYLLLNPKREGWLK